MRDGRKRGRHSEWGVQLRCCCGVTHESECTAEWVCVGDGVWARLRSRRAHCDCRARARGPRRPWCVLDVVVDVCDDASMPVERVRRCVLCCECDCWGSVWDGSAGVQLRRCSCIGCFAERATQWVCVGDGVWARLRRGRADSDGWARARRSGRPRGVLDVVVDVCDDVGVLVERVRGLHEDGERDSRSCLGDRVAGVQL